MHNTFLHCNKFILMCGICRKNNVREWWRKDNNNYRDCCAKFATGQNIIISHSSKSIWVIKLPLPLANTHVENRKFLLRHNTHSLDQMPIFWNTNLTGHFLAGACKNSLKWGTCMRVHVHCLDKSQAIDRPTRTADNWQFMIHKSSFKIPNEKLAWLCIG